LEWPDSVIGKLREQILAMRALWDCWQNGTKLNFRGQYYKLTLMSPFFDPGPIEHPAIPVFIAGVNPGLARLAGELCAGFVVHPFHSPRYLREVILPALSSGAIGAGRRPTDVAVSVTAFVATDAQAREAARSQIAFYASTPSYRPVMELHGWGQIAEQLSAHAARGEWDRMPALLTDEMLAEFCLLAEEAELASRLKDRYSGIATRLSLYEPFVPGEKDEFWRRVATAM
jgi:probable F420-dependent oxidoreductase